MRTSGLLVAPLDTPFLDDRGSLTYPWVRFLQELARNLRTSATNAAATSLPVDLPDGAGTTAITADDPSGNGALLAVKIKQGSPTGGQQITWGANFAPGTSVDIPMGAGEEILILFVGFEGLWCAFRPY